MQVPQRLSKVRYSHATLSRLLDEDFNKVVVGIQVGSDDTQAPFEGQAPEFAAQAHYISLGDFSA
jgi:hypothetical protein